MTPDEICKNLKAEQWQIYESYLNYFGDLDQHPERPQAFTDAIRVARIFLEALAERNRLLKGLIDNALMDESMHFLTIKVSEPMFAIIQAALKGVGE